MGKWFKRGVVLLGTTAVVMLGAEAGANAAPASPAAHPVTVASVAPARTTAVAGTATIRSSQAGLTVTAPAGTVAPNALAEYKFSKSQTQALYTAATAGVTALVATCNQLPVPAWVHSLCNGIGIAAGFLVGILGPPNGRCLHAFVQIGWPPVGLNYVNC